MLLPILLSLSLLLREELIERLEREERRKYNTTQTLITLLSTIKREHIEREEA